MEVTITYGETKWGTMSYLANDDIGSVLQQGKIHDEDLIMSVLHNIVYRAKVIFDVGAHAGSHSVLYGKINPLAQIYAFEPQFHQYHVLRHNLSIMKVTNVTTVNVALGNKTCEASMSDTIRDGPNAGLTITPGQMFNLGGRQIGRGKDIIQIKRLTDVFREYGLNTLSYIKIDVEGFENIVLDGGYDIIKKYKPIIFFEHNHKKLEDDMSDFYNLTAYTTIFDTLRSLDYYVVRINDSNYLAF